MFKLIIFDFDGPILNSFRIARDSVLAARREAINKKLIPAKSLPEITEEAVVRCWGYPGQFTLAKIFPCLTEKKIRSFY